MSGSTGRSGLRLDSNTSSLANSADGTGATSERSVLAQRPRVGSTALRLVLGRLAAAEREAAVLADRELNEALEPFRGHHPRRIACAKRGCGKTFSWWAFHPALPLVVFDSNAPRKRELDRGELPGGPWLGQQPPPPFNYWPTGPQFGTDSAEAAGLQGEEELRRIFRCPACGSPKTFTNSKMIGLLARALAGNQREIRA